jgi:hypothetical protein
MEVKTITERTIEHLRGKYIKRTLLALETYFGGPIPTEIRKTILDGYNDFTRDTLTELGYGDR